MSKLRELRERAGLSAAELARQAGVSANTVRNVEHGKSVDKAMRRSIVGSLTSIIQRDSDERLSDARAEVTRAEVALEAVRARLEHAQDAHEAEGARLRAEIDELWQELDNEAQDDAE